MGPSNNSSKKPSGYGGNKKPANKKPSKNKYPSGSNSSQLNNMQSYLNKQKAKEKKKADRDKALAEKQAKKAAAKAVKDAKRELKKAEKAKKKARIEETAAMKDDFKEERYLNGNPEHIAEKKEDSKLAKQIQKADGKCGKSAEWAPCALVPTLGRRDPTPCCNFDTNHCLRSSECDCPHCVDFAEVNRATKMVK